MAVRVREHDELTARYDPGHSKPALQLMDSTSGHLRPLDPADFDALAKLARTIWLAHYITIVTKEQIEYMLGSRFAPENLQRYVDASDRWMEVLSVDDELVGYCSYALTSTPGEMKLEQLYLLPSLHGRGLGKHMLDHVERRAREAHCRVLMLTVNKRNEKAIRVYQLAGFRVREEIVIDIGSGFVMDDYVMEKALVE